MISNLNYKSFFAYTFRDIIIDIKPIIIEMKQGIHVRTVGENGKILLKSISLDCSPLIRVGATKGIKKAVKRDMILVLS